MTGSGREESFGIGGRSSQGVALAADRAGLASTIVMPEWASISKQEATRGYGGKVILEGQSVADSIKRAQELSKDGKTFIHPFDDPSIIAGQGTVGLEIMEELSNADLIAVPVGGGGLVTGISVAARAIRTDIWIIGFRRRRVLQPSRPMKTGERITIEALRSIADGITVKQIDVFLSI